MSAVIHQERSVTIEPRQWIFPVVVVVVLLIFWSRAWLLQIAKSDQLREEAQQMRTATVKQLAPRGLIFDRNGKLLAGVRNQIVVTAIPNEIRKNPGVLSRLSAILGVSEKELETELAAGNWRPTVATPIYSKTTVVQATRIAEAPGLPGVAVSNTPMRSYTDTKHLSHVLGYVWTANERDVERLKEAGVDPPPFVGKIGLERYHELDLMGQQGFDRVSMGRGDVPLRTVQSSAATPGRRVVLGIDAELQRFAYELMAGREGSVVAIDPSTFEVITLVNTPSYDVAPFLRGITQREYRALEDDPMRPMINRAIYTGTAPGSTFKIVTALAGELSGHPPERFSAFCRGGIKIGNRFVRCLGHHGSVGFERAMAKSCNAYFIALGMRAGEDNLREASLQLGLGSRTGIDVTGEARGVIPTREWIQKVSRDGSYVWYPGDTANFSLGQGYVATTPLQMAVMMATVANGGNRYKPMVVRSMSDENGTMRYVSKELVQKIDGSPAFWNALHNSVHAVMVSGTAARAGAIPGLQWAGKTGSAERAGQSRTDSWFVGYAPLNNPKIAIAVRLSGAGHGSEAAVPVARDVVAKYLKMGPYAPPISPSTPVAIASNSPASPVSTR